ncbi:esterase/lipase family protein [Acinetobacter sp. MB5]|uniref:esterase/lipase family protein n=1 Tax=Acinetobacter sp. MB5 TaxID=2069438 RepID=UPI000DD02135|nr:alpha/beta fold hydrolase [Acinetobacter sp. MB5]
MHAKLLKSTFLFIPLLSSLILGGCQVVNVKQQALNITISNERDSILTRDKLSEASLNVLSMTGREAKGCANDPAACLQFIQKMPQIPEEQLFSTASELYLAKAKQLESSKDCKNIPKLEKNPSKKHLHQQQLHVSCITEEGEMLDKSIRYSYAYLFRSNREPQQRIFDNRQVQVRDFYNQAIAKLGSAYPAQAVDVQKHLPQSVKMGESNYRLDFSDYPELASQPIESYMSSYNLNFSGLRSINRRDGFGSEFVVILPKKHIDEENQYILDPLHYQFKDGVNPNIRSPRYLSSTITIEPEKNTSLQDLLNNSPMVIKIHDPYRSDRINIENNSYPLAANYSAPYGLWLAQNNLGKSAYLSLIDKDQNLAMPHLYMLEPFNPNKKVIVLIHGLASSPEAWIRLTNDIMGDPVLREHYQVWQVFYSTNMPIMESRFQIYALLKQSFALVDPKSPAYSDSVLIGHSMGGIIARLLVSHADLSSQAFKTLKSPSLLKKHRNDPIVLERLRIQPITNFDRAIFLSSPNKGTAFADRWFTKMARRIIRVPSVFVSAIGTTLQGDLNKSTLKQLDQNIIQNGPSDLSYKSAFIAITKNVNPPKGFIFHSIIGNDTKSNDPAKITDGVVPYSSAHLDGAASEKIIHGGHSIQETPEAVLELRRILRLHLIQHGLYQAPQINQ